MTPQQKNLILNALRIGEDAVRPITLYSKNERGDTIRAAIKELESMSTTEEVK